MSTSELSGGGRCTANTAAVYQALTTLMRPFTPGWSAASTRRASTSRSTASAGIGAASHPAGRVRASPVSAWAAVAGAVVTAFPPGR
ncbi:hypothetical protein [Streptomyces sp. TLI_053]|uniref:hypothetical protein n=1 Tax=Streptomyces sp. TLI_053 TaxID=1855352 RepID=UPI0013520E78|nr:hypothetical protein [Streptomyces sp. TLI_053]